MKILDRWNRKVLFECEAVSIKECVGKAYLARAYLARADLAGADLTGAYLTGADLTGADLAGAYLARADLTDSTILPLSVSFREFRDEIVPQLLTAGGKSLKAVVDSGCWECHKWTNCPMHEALAIDKEQDAPALLRPWVKLFVQLFDANLIPKPVCEVAL